MISGSANRAGFLPAPIMGMCLALCLAMCAPSASAAASSPDPFAPSSTGLRQIAEIMGRLSKTMGDIPPNIDRIALSQIKVDPKEFSPGISRYIQAQIEEVFRKEGRKTVVTSPELRTFRVVATDSTFKFSNTLPSMEDLWKLGDKLRVDGYIEGSCSKSADNDVILNLKVFRHRTGEIVWSNSFVAGPNEKKPDIWNLDWSASANVTRFPIQEGIVPSAVASDSLGRPKLDTLSNLALTMYGIEGTVSEAVTPDKFLLFSVSLGYGFANGTGGPDSLAVNFNIQMVNFGIEMLGIFFRKSNPDLGYWLGTYVGYKEFVPFNNRGHLSTLTVGYKSRVSRHFTLGGGILFMPLNNKLKGLGADEENRFLTLEPVAYELTYLHYTF
ncbi:MAG: hypothetical protein JWO30_540 [Fibrobacteres bacterium]|nr:hypothetical protein [Fibrobacterota bacterium]